MSNNRREYNRIEVDGNIARIYMKHDLVTLIDLIDLDKAKELCWHGAWSKLGSTWYAYAGVTNSEGKDSSVSLHRFITNAPKGTHVDHKNHNTLDNRRENLVVTTPVKNGQNRLGANKNSSTGIRGVYKQKAKGAGGKELLYWIVRVMVYGKSKTKNFPYTDEGFYLACKYAEYLRTLHMDNNLPIVENNNSTGVECVYKYYTRVGREPKYLAKVNIGGKVYTKNGFPFTMEGLDQAKQAVEYLRKQHN